jgi:ribokinase
VRRGQLIFETHGQCGVYVEHEGRRDLCSTSELKVQDTTGAGDTFAGATLAALADGASPLAAASCGTKAALELLSGRMSSAPE